MSSLVPLNPATGERLDHAVRIADDTRFGLGASVWTTDPSQVSPSPAGTAPVSE